MYEEKKRLSTNDRPSLTARSERVVATEKKNERLCLKQAMTLVADARQIIRLSISEDRSRIGARVGPIRPRKRLALALTPVMMSPRECGPIPIR